MTTATQSGAAKTEAPATEGEGAKLNFGMEWSEDDAAEELLQKFLDADKGTDADTPSVEKKKDKKSTPEPAAGDDAEEDDESPSDDGDDADEGTDDGEDDGEESDGDKKYAEDGTYIKFTVDGEQKEISVKDVARLAGQEAALTKKSMEVAEQRKVADADLQRQAASSTALLARARERFEPFSKLDFHLLATQLPPEDYTVLRQSAQAAYEDVAFLEQHQDGFVKAIAERTQTTLREKAVKSLAILSGPTDKGGIDGWTEKLYDEIRAHAVANGAPAEVINQLTDAWAIRLIHEAMLYRRGKVKSDGKSKVVVKKINKTPKRIVKTSNDAATKGSKTLDANRAMKRLANSGSTDDAAAALLAGWANQDSDD